MTVPLHGLHMWNSWSKELHTIKKLSLDRMVRWAQWKGMQAYKLRLTVIVLDPNQGKSVEKVNPANIPRIQLAVHHLQIAEETFC